MKMENYVALDEQDQARGRSSTAALVARLRRDAVKWSATCGDLFEEAADEIDELISDIAWLTRMHSAQVVALKAALAAEREECAKVAEEISPLTAGKVIAAAIRARGQK